MKRIRILFAAALVTLAGAATVGAADPEDYEMATYQVAFYRKGPAWVPSTTDAHKQLQADHLAHIGKMADSGKLILAGPFGDGGDLRGMLIFRVDSADEAKALAEQDPAVKAGRLVLEWHPWFAAKNITVTAKGAPAK